MQTDEDGAKLEVAGSEEPADAAADTQAKDAEAAPSIDAPFCGFDAAGEYFVVRVHKQFGYIFILGWLQKSADWLKMHIAQQAMKAEQNKLLKPKGFRGFNPFKKG